MDNASVGGVAVVAAAKVLLSLCCVGACGLATYLYYVLWVAPRRVLAEFRRQGIGGPPPSFPYGNLADMREAVAAAKAARATSSSARHQHRVGGENGGRRDDIVHDYRPAVLPFYEKWRKEHGLDPDPGRRRCGGGCGGGAVLGVPGRPRLPLWSPECDFDPSSGWSLDCGRILGGGTVGGALPRPGSLLQVIASVVASRRCGVVGGSHLRRSWPWAFIASRSGGWWSSSAADAAQQHACFVAGVVGRRDGGARADRAMSAMEGSEVERKMEGSRSLPHRID